MKVPKHRFPAQHTIKSLAAEFSYPYNNQMQDWEYEVSTIIDVEKYFEKYTSTDDEDIRFILMEMILETSNEEQGLNWIAGIWPRTKDLLTKNFSLHEFSVYRWSCFNDEIEAAFYISPWMRSLWEELAGKDR